MRDIRVYLKFEKRPRLQSLYCLTLASDVLVNFTSNTPQVNFSTLAEEITVHAPIPRCSALEFNLAGPGWDPDVPVVVFAALACSILLRVGHQGYQLAPLHAMRLSRPSQDY